MGLRDLLITAIVAGTLPLVLKHSYIGVLLWTWLSLMNPHRLAWGFAAHMPFAAATAGVTLISLITTRDPRKLPLNAIVYTLIAFVAWMSLTTLTAIDPSQSLPWLTRVLKIQLMTLVALAVLHEKRHLQLFIWMTVIALGFFGVKGGLFTLATGGHYRVWGPSGSFIADNNALALAIIMVIPLMYYLRQQATKAATRWGLAIGMLLSSLAALGSQSRGAFLAISAMLFLLWWRSPYKLRFGVPAVILVFSFLAFMPESWVDRMETIKNYQADASAMGRINAWWTMFRVANNRPVGGGFRCYTPEVFKRFAPYQDIAPKAAHSIYFEVLGEHGWVGLGLFLTLWLLVWRTAAQLRVLTRKDPRLRWIFDLAGMCQVSLVGYAVGGAFLSLAYFDLPYDILIMIVVSQRWLTTHLAQGDAPPTTSAPSKPKPRVTRITRMLPATATSRQ